MSDDIKTALDEIKNQDKVPPDDEQVRLWMSALLDGELSEDEQELFFLTLESREDLLHEFNNFVEQQSEMASFAHPECDASGLPEDFTNQIMAEIDTESVDAVQRQISQMIDSEIEIEDVQSILENGDLVEHSLFLDNSLLLRQQLNGLTNLSASENVVSRSMSVIQADERSFVLFSKLMDAESSDVEDLELSELLTDGFNASYRQNQVEHMYCVKEIYAATQEILQSTLEMNQVADAVAHNLAAEQGQLLKAQQSTQPRVTGDFGEKSWFSSFAERFLPLTSAAAMTAACLLLLVTFTERSPNKTNDTNRADKTTVVAFANVHSFTKTDDKIRDNKQSDIGQLDIGNILDDNSIEIEDVDSDDGNAMVIATETSNITIIWMSDDAPSLDDDTEMEL